MTSKDRTAILAPRTMFDCITHRRRLPLPGNDRKDGSLGGKGGMCCKPPWIVEKELQLVPGDIPITKQGHATKHATGLCSRARPMHYVRPHVLQHYANVTTCTSYVPSSLFALQSQLPKFSEATVVNISQRLPMLDYPRGHSGPLTGLSSQTRVPTTSCVSISNSAI